MDINIEQQLDYYLNTWNLIIKEDPIFTNTSLLQVCFYQDGKAMLKIPLVEEERRGSELMQWWDGIGSAKILKYDNNAILLEWIENNNAVSLERLVKQGLDNQATKIICDTAKQLHNPREKYMPKLVSLDKWFKSLVTSTRFSCEALASCAFLAKRLLKNQEELCVLHGDLHHKNVLYSDIHGWLAIDPKGLYGDRAFDFANILCNPNPEIALAEGRLMQQLKVISCEANIKIERMLNWTIAWAGLSAFWMEEDNLDASLAIEFVKLALSLKGE